MSAPGQLDETIRSIVRDVVREEVRAALDARHVADARRNRSSGGDGYLSIARAAAFADVAPGTLRRWIRSGRLAARRAGRVYRIERATLVDFLARDGRAADVIERARDIVGRVP